MKPADQEPGTQPESLQRLLRRSVYVLLLAAFVLSGALIVAADVWAPSRTKVALQAGEVAPQDILAPRSLKYESEVLSQTKRDAEIAAVRPIYDPPDPSVRSDQLKLAREILDFIENVRYDDFASVNQKKADIGAITDLSLDPPVLDALLAIQDDDRWRDIDAQVTRLLERAMSGEVREDNIQAKRDDLPNLISASYSESEVRIITAIVSDLIKINAFYNEELTHQAQLQAAENVPVEVRTFAKGQMIIRAGEIATAAHIEALEQFGLLRATHRRTEQFLGGIMAMFLVTALLAVDVRKFHPKVYDDPPFMVLLGLLFLIFLGGAQLVGSANAVLPYYFPASALAFLVATLVGPQFGIVVTMTLAALAGFMAGDSLEFAIVIGAGGTLGVLSLGRTERLNAYFMGGGVVSLVGVCVSLLFALGTTTAPDLVTVLSQIAGSVVNGLFSAAGALVGLYVITNLLNIPTSLKIVELLQPNHPLLQRLLREAPGTYQHSLQVANLAELGAQQVNANPSLLRVAAMYHDVGKILNPHFFVENQADGVNPHTLLNNPSQSARIIIGHVTEGDRLARRYRLPNRIRDFIMEHHGTTQVMYFYRDALKRAETTNAPVDVAEYTYPGPRPQSRETAILMLADGCESSVRARRPQSKDDIRETVDFIFESRLQGGQLDESGLTLNDLRVLRDAFLTALQGVFHPRIAYPGMPGQVAGTVTSDQSAQLTAGGAATEASADKLVTQTLHSVDVISPASEEAETVPSNNHRDSEPSDDDVPQTTSPQGETGS